MDRTERLRIGVAFLELGGTAAAARQCGRSISAVHVVLTELGLIQPQKRPKLGDDLVERMYAHYLAHGSLNSVAREFARDRRVVREIFVRRGFQLIHAVHMGERDPKSGRIVAKHLHTAAELDAMVAAAKVVGVPDALKLEWRTWPLARKAEFLRRIRMKLGAKRDAPVTPCSAELEPFDYGSERAHAICREANQGLPSRLWKVRIDARSQGVIYRGKLWFWSEGTGYQCGPWTREHGRPSLHRVIWEEAHARKLPPSNVVVFLDGNRNNHDPSNLGLITRRQLLAQNSGGWTKNNPWVNFYRRHDALFAELQAAVASGEAARIEAAQDDYAALRRPEYSAERKAAVSASTKAWWAGLTREEKKAHARKIELGKHRTRHAKVGTALERLVAA